KVPPSMKQKWQALLDDYLRSRECLKGLILVMDIRHPLKEFDEMMLGWANQCNLPVHILLNKCDKLTQSATSKVLREVKERLAIFANETTVQGFSALRGKGVKELREKMDAWFSL